MTCYGDPEDESRVLVATDREYMREVLGWTGPAKGEEWTIERSPTGGIRKVRKQPRDVGGRFTGRADGGAVRVERFDAVRLDRFERTPSGGLRIPAYLARIGIQEYRDAEGNVVRELRPPDEVFDAASVGSFADAPVTDLHPPGAVDAYNWREVAVGTVTSPRVDLDRIVAELVVLDADLIRKIEAGERVEVSAGYSCDLEWTPGAYDGEPYDAVQRNIRINHVALGPAGWGRAGPTVSLQLNGG